jgi:hypothetical protein
LRSIAQNVYLGIGVCHYSFTYGLLIVADIRASKGLRLLRKSVTRRARQAEYGVCIDLISVRVAITHWSWDCISYLSASRKNGYLLLAFDCVIKLLY